MLLSLFAYFFLSESISFFVCCTHRYRRIDSSCKLRHWVVLLLLDRTPFKENFHLTCTFAELLKVALIVVTPLFFFLIFFREIWIFFLSFPERGVWFPSAPSTGVFDGLADCGILGNSAFCGGGVARAIVLHWRPARLSPLDFLRLSPLPTVA